MTLRRYRSFAATPRPDPDRRRVWGAVSARDRTCVGPRAGLPGACFGRPEHDHVRASRALGRKNRTTVDNVVLLCAAHHRWKTEHGRTARPLLVSYLAGP